MEKKQSGISPDNRAVSPKNAESIKNDGVRSDEYGVEDSVVCVQPTAKRGKNFNLKAVMIAVITALAFFCGFFTNCIIIGKSGQKASWVINMIDRFYYSEEDGKIKRFTEEDYAKMITAYLDRYSTYYTKEEYLDVLNTDKGNNFGVGISLNADPVLTLYRVVGNSPAYKSGLRRGDKIVGGKRENSERVDFSKNADVIDFISSTQTGEPITFYYTRNGSEEKTASLTKNVFVTSYVSYEDDEYSGEFESEGTNKPEFVSQKKTGGFPLASDTAYLSFAQFEGDGANQIKIALSFMKSRGKTKLILDLRNNGGGDMDILCRVASQFLYSSDKVVAIAKYKDGITQSFRAIGDGMNDNIKKITVLANENTASASECLIGAMTYYKRAFDESGLIIEKKDGVARTYGKGIMQTTYENLLSGDAIKLTTAFIYQPDGATCIHNKGFVAQGNNAVDPENAVGRAIEYLSGK